METKKIKIKKMERVVSNWWPYYLKSQILFPPRDGKIELKQGMYGPPPSHVSNSPFLFPSSEQGIESQILVLLPIFGIRFKLIFMFPFFPNCQAGLMHLHLTHLMISWMSLYYLDI